MLLYECIVFVFLRAQVDTLRDDTVMLRYYDDELRRFRLKRRYAWGLSGFLSGFAFAILMLVCFIH